MRFLLDTNIISQAMRGNARVIARLAAAQRHERFVSAVTYAEIEYGIARLAKAGRGTARRRGELKSLFDALLTYIEVAAWDRAAAGRYAAARVECEAMGRTVDQADLMIAAHAASLGAVLVTADQTLLRRPRPRSMPAAVNWMAPR